MAHFRIGIGTVQQLVQIHFRRLPVDPAFPLFQPVGTAYHLVHGAEAKAGHNLAQVLGHEFQIVDYILRLSVKPFPQLFILCADAEWTGIQIADPEHMAAKGNQGAGTEGEQLRPEQGGHGHIPASQYLTVNFDLHPIPKPVQQ